jgi:D-cysteine desulfhydrase
VTAPPVYPPRVELARLPTPVQPLPRATAALGAPPGTVELWVKRDDLTGAVLSGNKIRKLEFLFADALAQGADTVLTCGGAQSNHARATALAAARLGLRAHLILRGTEPSPGAALEGNLLLDRLAGAEVTWVTPEEYGDREALFEELARSLRAAGRTPYVVVEGGSDAVGAWGYVRCAEEIAAHGFDTIVHAVGSGGTSAGLLAGRSLAGLAARVVGVNVCDDAAYFRRRIAGITAALADRYALPRARHAESDIEILDGFVGRGYALSRPEELAALRDLARAEGVVLDPVYSGKAWYALVTTLRRDPSAFGRRVLFLHTGGIFGLFPKAADLAPLL